MKILYSVQATGNGHISRSMELLPYLEQYGHVDIFLSGANSSLALDAPVKFRSKGLSLFYTCQGTLNYGKMIRNISPVRIMKEVRDLPVEKYDLVINDFECITSLACARKKVASINFGHQASFLSANTPRPEKVNKVGEWILRNYARATENMGLHFQCYDTFIYPPVIKEEILAAEPADLGHVTVYLPSYCDNELKRLLMPLKDFSFEIFSHQKSAVHRDGHLSFIPVSRKEFNRSLIYCHAIITGGGFETPAEALYLKKKLMSVPIHGQYEQQCNAAALKQMGVVVMERLAAGFEQQFQHWINNSSPLDIRYEYNTADIVARMIAKTGVLKKKALEAVPEQVV
jgi:uncharacterized protein (TIGR00661 family)